MESYIKLMVHEYKMLISNIHWALISFQMKAAWWAITILRNG